MYNRTRADLSPFMTAGQGALANLASYFGFGPGGTGGPTDQSAAGAFTALQNYPGYQFQMQQGMNALDRSAASRGLLRSGAQIRGAQQFGQGLASTSANSYLDALRYITGLGESAAAGVGGFGAQAGQGIANSQLLAGQAQAAGQVGSANALQSGIQGALTNGLQAYYMSQGGVGGSGSPITAGLGGYVSGGGVLPDVFVTPRQ